jgi:hypothetical protein
MFNGQRRRSFKGANTSFDTAPRETKGQVSGLKVSGKETNDGAEERQKCV